MKHRAGSPRFRTLRDVCTDLICLIFWEFERVSIISASRWDAQPQFQYRPMSILSWRHARARFCQNRFSCHRPPCGGAENRGDGLVWGSSSLIPSAMVDTFRKERSLSSSQAGPAVERLFGYPGSLVSTKSKSVIAWISGSEISNLI
jgi:hypothetical protein